MTGYWRSIQMQRYDPQVLFLPDNADEFPFADYDYVVDAVDTVTAKISLVMKCQEMGIPIISAMGAGNKLDPTQFRVADIYKPVSVHWPESCAGN